MVKLGRIRRLEWNGNCEERPLGANPNLSSKKRMDLATGLLGIERKVVEELGGRRMMAG